MSDPIARLNAALSGRYHVERQLGEGGMATVYLARDEKHNRNVAFKVLKPELAAVVGAERFLAEIQTTARLQHPHILPLYDSGEADGLLFYVMPYVEGEGLRERLDREHQLPVDDAVRIATSMAEALDYAHRHGVIHRDIKPANVLLADGKPVISDFGIALAVSSGGGSRLTATGLSMGTPHYMSPEQATGDQSVGPATDIWALGCVLYEMLVGEPPFTGSTPQAVLGKIIQAEPASAARTRQTITPQVDSVVRRALEKVPADRFRSAGQFAAALADPGFLHGETRAGAAAAVQTAVAAWRRISVGLASLAAALTLALAWALLRPDPPLPVGRFEVPLPEGWTGLIGTGPGMTVSPDGSQIVFAGSQDGLPMLWRRPLDQLAQTAISGTERGRNPEFSPDGAALAFTAGGTLKTLSLTGTSPLTLVADGVEDSGVAWGEDGWLYFRRSGGIWRVSGSGGEPEPVMVEGGELYSWPSALPGGRGILMTRNLGGPSEDQVVAWDAASREVRPLVQGASAHYAASGHLLFTSGEGSLVAVPFDSDRLVVTGPPVTLFEGIQVNSGSASYFSVSENGALVYLVRQAGGGARRLVVLDLAGRGDTLPLAPRTLQSVSWSPGGDSVMFRSEAQIYTYDVVRNTTPRPLTVTGNNFRPVFSPSGGRIVFGSLREGTDDVDLFVKDLGDDSPEESLITLPGRQYPTQWVSDTLITFVHGEATSAFDLWTLDLSDPNAPEAKPYLTSESELERMSVSPDGTLAAYASAEPGGSEIYVSSFPDPGERIQVSQEGGAGVLGWSQDGNTLYFATAVTGGASVVAARLERNPRPKVLTIEPLFELARLSTDPSTYALHPEGDRFVFAVPSDDSQIPPQIILVQNLFEELKRLVPN